MATKKPTESWIETLHRKRDALYSTVVIVESNDDKRVKEFIAHLDQAKGKIYIYDTYSGLMSREGGVDRPTGGGGLMDNPMDTIGKYLLNEEGVTVVVKNVLEKTDVIQKALNLWATHDDVIDKNNTLVAFVPGRDIIDQRVLDKCILVTPPLSLAEERWSLLNVLLDNVKVNLKKDEIDQLVQITGGLDLNQTEAVFVETMQDYNQTNKVNFQLVAKTKAESISKASVLKVLSNVDKGFEAVGGYDSIKEYIRETVILPLLEPARAKEIGLEPPRGMILFGPGGTGKTLLSKALAKEVAWPFVFLSPENFMSSYVGETERNLRKAIQIIEDMAPCIVFIDEIDRLGGRGQTGENDGGTMRRAFSQMLEYLGDEKRKAFVIGATNIPFMDAAFRREGRFDVMVPMLSPDMDARYQILKVHLNVARKVNHTLDDESIRVVAKGTIGWKGNMLEELIKRATRVAFNHGASKVQPADLIEAFSDYTPNKDALLKDEVQYVNMANELCNSKRFLQKLMKNSEADTNARMGKMRKKIGEATPVQVDLPDTNKDVKE